MSDGAHVATWAPVSAAERYERGRPDYPASAVAVLRDRLGLGPGSRVADVAAGTGKLTRLLVGTGATVVAVEPMAGMRSQLRVTSPAAAPVAGVAEHLPLASASLDGVTIAQAFHWLRLPEAAVELARVLAPGGHLAILSNRPRPEEGWQSELWEILRRYEQRRPRPPEAAEWRERLAASGCFAPLDRVELAHEQRFASLADFDDRMGSISHVQLLDEGERAEMFAEMHKVLGGRDPIVLRLRTLVELAVPAR